jgi:hypothetical protein
VRVPLAPPLVRHLSMVYPRERMHSRLVSSFIRSAAAHLRASCAEASEPAGPREALEHTSAAS